MERRRTDTLLDIYRSQVGHTDLWIDIDQRFTANPADEFIGLLLKTGRARKVGSGSHGLGEKKAEKKCEERTKSTETEGDKSLRKESNSHRTNNRSTKKDKKRPRRKCEDGESKD